METNIFDRCHTETDVKSMFRYHVQLVHPDKGGTAAQFIELRKQFETALIRVLSTGQQVQAQAQAQAQPLSVLDSLALQVKSLNLPNIHIIQRGDWLWIENTTKDMYFQLKSLGFNWSKKRRAMYFAENLGPKRRYASKMSDSELNQKYGTRSY